MQRSVRDIFQPHARESFVLVDFDQLLSTLKARSKSQSEPAPARSVMLLRTAPGFEHCFGVRKWRSKVEKRSFLDRDSCQCNNMRWSDPSVIQCNNMRWSDPSAMTNFHYLVD
jgi:hypothetical protein